MFEAQRVLTPSGPLSPSQFTLNGVPVESLLAPVPEPATWATLAAGLLVLAVCLRRRCAAAHSCTR
jgi:hypothetical protein